MADRDVRSYPPVGDPGRLDAIMSSGRSMRRRRRLGAGAGAGGAVLAAMFAVVLVTGTGTTDDANVVADGEDVPTTTSTTTTAPSPELMQVRIAAGAEGTVSVTVVDPDQPALDAARQCLSVTVLDDAGEPVATGHGCNDGPGDSTADPIELSLVDPMLGVSTCAPWIEPGDPDQLAPETRSATTTFDIVLPELPTGSYSIETEATSGSGDGCPGTDPASNEIENQASSSLPALEVP